jgi:hypothetical protein
MIRFLIINDLIVQLTPSLTGLKFPFDDCSILSANNLTGELPIALTNLTKLTELLVIATHFYTYK